MGQPPLGFRAKKGLGFLDFSAMLFYDSVQLSEINKLFKITFHLS